MADNHPFFVSESLCTIPAYRVSGSVYKISLGLDRINEKPYSLFFDNLEVINARKIGRNKQQLTYIINVKHTDYIFRYMCLNYDSITTSSFVIKDSIKNKLILKQKVRQDLLLPINITTTPKNIFNFLKHILVYEYLIEINKTFENAYENYILPFYRSELDNYDNDLISFFTNKGLICK